MTVLLLVEVLETKVLAVVKVTNVVVVLWTAETGWLYCCQRARAMVNRGCLSFINFLIATMPGRVDWQNESLFPDGRGSCGDSNHEQIQSC